MNSEFRRENRYIVVKHRKLDDQQLNAIKVTFEMYDIEQLKKAVVVESDWPEYETVWAMIEARCSGQSLSAHPAGDVALREAHEHLMQAASITGNLAWQSELNRLTARIDAYLATPAAPTTDADPWEGNPAREGMPDNWAAPTDAGYKDAYYEIADMLDIPAQTLSPREVFETQIKPRILTALRASTGTPAEGEVLDPEEFFATAIDDSLDMDWTGTVGAKAIIRRMEEQGLVLCAR